MEVITAILGWIAEFWNMLKTTMMPYGFSWAVFFIALLVLDIIAEFFGVGLFGGHKEIK